MEPRQRVAAAMKGQKPDKLPIMVANSNTFICQYYGMSVGQFLSDAELCTLGNVRFTEEFGIDYNLCVNGYILYGCGPEIGCEWKFAGRDFPGFTTGPLNNEKDLARLTVPRRPSGYFAHYLEVIRRLNGILGRRYHLSVSILGPYAVACFLRGIENALLDTIRDQKFLKAYMELATELSIWFGRQILATGIENPILNEIFLTPEMIRPDVYHQLIAPYDRRVQEILGPDKAPNSLAAFMGRPGDIPSQQAGALLYRAFFKGADSLDELKAAVANRLQGMPIPVSISGPSLDAKPGEELVRDLHTKLDFLVKEQGMYPSILLASVQADSKEKARQIAGKIRLIRSFRDQYQL